MLDFTQEILDEPDDEANEAYVGPDLVVLNLLMSSSFYSINRALRAGEDARMARSECGWEIDGMGWRSEAEFAHDVTKLFAEVYLAGQLGSHAGQRAYRGIWLEPEDLQRMKDERLIWDDGYSFAASTFEEAAGHLWDGTRTDKAGYSESLVPVILEFTLGRYSITIPAPGDPDLLHTRRRDLHHLYGLPAAQHILERRSLIRVTSMENIGLVKGIIGDVYKITGRHTF